MKAKIKKHKWSAKVGLKCLRCIRCNCEKYVDHVLGKFMYRDRYGKITHHAPKCVLPNTKL